MRTALVFLLVASATGVALADSQSYVEVTVVPKRAKDDGAQWQWWHKDSPNDPSKWKEPGRHLGFPNGTIVVKASQPRNSQCVAPPTQEVTITPGQGALVNLAYTGC